MRVYIEVTNLVNILQENGFHVSDHVEDTPKLLFFSLQIDKVIFSQC